MPRDLIVFGEDWGGLPSSTQHLVKHLAADRKVLWVNSIGLRRPRCSGHDVSRALAKLLSKLGTTKIAAASQAVPHNICVVNPLTLPAPRHRLERQCAAQLLEHQLKPKMKAMGMNKPLLWISLPTAVDMVGRLGESGVIYYCGDDFASLAGVDHAVVSLREGDLVGLSDIIITASEQLTARFPQSKTHTLCHGVDFALFSQPTQAAHDLPSNGKPTAGFYGSLSAWLDTELLSEVIPAMPNWNFVFIGKEEADMSCLKGFDNAFFLGPRAHRDLPRYSQHWQVSLLPFRDNAQIRACNPLKLVEYLATGGPIVSTDFPALAPYRHLVQRARGAEDFAEAMAMSIHLDTLEHFPTAVQSCVANNTWQAKSATVARWLEAL